MFPMVGLSVRLCYYKLVPSPCSTTGVVMAVVPTAHVRLVSLIRLSLVFVNSPRRKSGVEDGVRLLPTPFCVGVTMKGQEPNQRYYKDSTQ